ncbi:dioxygenase [Streptomyces sp. YC504]|uniref:Dioxygenase n=1 Tax=Streptomyces mesophilus TaxID=1775132 RepID=A0A6G4XAE0_9ACTN|nr:dioxygenase [Streptomyces mesophilus]NGO74516.1 dioxygenase [Streptomyces mesophilus]
MQRRGFLTAGAASVAALSGIRATQATAAAPEESPTAAGDAPPLTRNRLEGPYYLDYDLNRIDITEGRRGVPLDLRIQVLAAGSGRPLPDVAVDVWQCDALGLYSGYERTTLEINARDKAPSGAAGQLPSGRHLPPDSRTTYLRGFQMTDGDGRVRFRTIVPGWYTGRAVHVHLKVHHQGVLLDGAYADGTTMHTGQLYFPEDLLADLRPVAPYSSNPYRRTPNSEDRFYTGTSMADGMVEATWDRREVARGVDGALTLVVDPAAEHVGHVGSRSSG